MGSKDPRQDLLPHMTFPMPDLKNIPKPGTLSREETLKTILSNLDQHQQATRLNIIAAGKQALAQAVEAQHSNHRNNNDEEEFPEIETSDPAGMDLFLANLSTPYHDSMGDPLSSPSTIPPTPPVPQATPPLTIQHTKATLDTLALYDSIAVPERKFYSDALERLTGPVPPPPPPPPPPTPSRRNSSVSSIATATTPTVFAKPSPREPYGRAAGSSVPGLFGKPSPADPRLAGRKGSASWARPSPVQSPVERTAGSASWARPSPVQSPVERPTDPRLRR